MMNRRQFQRTLLAGAGALFLPDIRAFDAPRAPLRINPQRLAQHLTELAEFGKNPQGGVSRVAYTDFDRQGRAYVLGLMRAARLEPQIDLAGNIIARRAGSARNLKPIVFGSHIDSVPEGGNYDGTLGSLAAIEVAQTLAEYDITLRHPIEVVVWQNEEGGKQGSRCVSGELTDKDLDLTNASGKTIRDGIKFLGGDPARLSEVKRKPGAIAGYFELHIEQGGTLERDRIQIGEVEGIVGIKWWNVDVTGFANHAGTTPMDQRQDALVAAARFVDMVNTTARTVVGRQVATVGRIQAFPGARNVIPGRVSLSLEIRELDAARLDGLFEQIRAESARIGAATGTSFAYESAYSSTPSLMDERMRALVRESAKELGFTSKVLPSGAGHDAQSMATLAPAGMIFVPSVKGISHAPQEYTAPQDCANGANVLLHSVLKLDEASWLTV
jgi:N-carbamoyl-L-amino-acid hydrolase